MFTLYTYSSSYSSRSDCRSGGYSSGGGGGSSNGWSSCHKVDWLYPQWWLPVNVVLFNAPIDQGEGGS